MSQRLICRCCNDCCPTLILDLGSSPDVMTNAAMDCCNQVTGKYPLTFVTYESDNDCCVYRYCEAGIGTAEILQADMTVISVQVDLEITCRVFRTGLELDSGPYTYFTIALYARIPCADDSCQSHLELYEGYAADGNPCTDDLELIKQGKSQLECISVNAGGDGDNCNSCGYLPNSTPPPTWCDYFSTDLPSTVSLGAGDPGDADHAASISCDNVDCPSTGIIWVFLRCCTQYLRNPITGLLIPEFGYWVLASGPTPDVSSVYKLTDENGNVVCATFSSSESFNFGTEATITDGPFELCTDCLVSCDACCTTPFEQFLQRIYFTLPTITNPYDFDPDCAGIYSAYNALYAGQQVDIAQYANSCVSTFKTLGPFNYTTSGGCSGSGTDGLVNIQTELFDAGGGNFSIRVHLTITGSGGTFADYTYTYTQAGCLNCLTGSYVPTGVNNLGSPAAPSITVNLEGVECTGEAFEMMELAQPQTEEEALALTPGTKFIAPDGSIRVV